VALPDLASVVCCRECEAFTARNYICSRTGSLQYHWELIFTSLCG